MALTRTQRKRMFRGIQYLIGLVVVVIVALLIDWPVFVKAWFNLDIAWQMFPDVLATGLVNTLLYTALGFTFGIALAIVLALMRLSSIKVYRAVAMAYIELFRGLPALAVLVIIAYGLPRAFPGFKFPGDTLGQVAVGLGVTAAAYMAETLRAGIQAVPKGQVEAARTLGMSPGRTMVTIVLPQALRIVIPPLTNEIILLVKDSSLVYILGVTTDQYELTKYGQSAINEFASVTPLTVIAVLYLFITLPLSWLVRRLERRHAKAR
ncbi:amino acid ABC transporter permease [Nakamurella lactea]|uniref:amino acid ABC transporter permease n=1 Tax=Nakamurella lactea TaxID=459515 RepID=UPI000421143F|nr:amino acid ABC transporter permease [Nakamurella lactea]